ncbi:MAG TPA: hypothetical protein VMD91_17895 [Candidatus Sulfotelmatobacter sp.]|nr:hypothetical protein [Candidatus Sulfotelmatobacter sp.]
MNAAADYAAAAAQLTRTLPAYVAYTDRTEGGFGPFHGGQSSKVVVHVPDGRVISGHPATVHFGTGNWREAELLTNPPFRPACYAPTDAQAATFDGKPAERIALRPRCRTGEDDADFTVLYVDPNSRAPLAVVGTDDDKDVQARVEERFIAVDGYTVPAGLHVKVKGEGWMGWLDVTANVELSDYRFSATPL